MRARRPIGTCMVGPVEASTPPPPRLSPRHRGGSRRRPGLTTKCFASAKLQTLGRRHLRHSGGGVGSRGSGAATQCLRGGRLGAELHSLGASATPLPLVSRRAQMAAPLTPPSTSRCARPPSTLRPGRRSSRSFGGPSATLSCCRSTAWAPRRSTTRQLGPGGMDGMRYSSPPKRARTAAGRPGSRSSPESTWPSAFRTRALRSLCRRER